LVGKPERNRQLGRLGRRWENNIIMDFKEVGMEVVDWIHPAKNGDQCQDLVNTVMNLWVFIKGGEFVD
jgi:hypothetical protein